MEVQGGEEKTTLCHRDRRGDVSLQKHVEFRPYGASTTRPFRGVFVKRFDPCHRRRQRPVDNKTESADKKQR